MENKKKKNIFDLVWKQLNSIKFAVVILILLAVVSILTIYIQQKLPMDRGIEYYRQNLSKSEFAVFNALDLFNPYHSFWYLILLGLLILNISVCTVSRIKRVWKSMFKIEFFENENSLLKLDLSKKKLIKSDLDEVSCIISTHFRKKGYKTFQKNVNDKKMMFFTRGRWNRFSFPLIHLSIIFLAVGGIVGNIGGFEKYQYAAIDEVFQAPERDFFVKVKDVWLELTETGQPKDYFSRLAVIKDGNEVFEKTIEVNSPLKYEGLKFFQSEFYMNPEKVKDAVIEINYKENNRKEFIRLKTGEKVNIPDTEYKLELKKYLSHFVMGPDNKPYSASRNPNNPAIYVGLYRGEKHIEDKWMFVKFPDFHGKSSVEEFKMKFVDITPEYITGLQIGYNPGASFLWIGFILISTGVVLAFYTSHRKFWVNLVKEGDNVALYTAANSNKNKTGLKRDFEKYLRVINNIK